MKTERTIKRLRLVVDRASLKDGTTATSIVLPSSTIDEIDHVWPEMGFPSRSAFLRYAVTVGIRKGQAYLRKKENDRKRTKGDVNEWKPK